VRAQDNEGRGVTVVEGDAGHGGRCACVCAFMPACRPCGGVVSRLRGGAVTSDEHCVGTVLWVGGAPGVLAAAHGSGS